jgi:sugar/nucleoside kinase (ribokinase family)
MHVAASLFCRIPGGSAANVMKGVANLSAGRVCCKFMGMVGTDSTAQAYKQMLQQQGVQPVLLVSGGVVAAGRVAEQLARVK